LAERTRVDYRWRLSSHLLPYFAERMVSALTVEDVDRYRAHKVAECERITRAREQCETKARPLSNESINKTLVLLAAVLESAVEYGYLPANPARGKRRRLKAATPSRSFLNPEQVEALLRAAAALDTEATRARDSGRRSPLPPRSVSLASESANPSTSAGGRSTSRAAPSTSPTRRPRPVSVVSI